MLMALLGGLLAALAVNAALFMWVWRRDRVEREGRRRARMLRGYLQSERPAVCSWGVEDD